MYVLKNNKEVNRIGISVSKKVGNSVVRHRVTRLVRESYRLHENIFNSGLDIVVIGRNNAKIGFLCRNRKRITASWKTSSYN